MRSDEAATCRIPSRVGEYLPCPAEGAKPNAIGVQLRQNLIRKPDVPPGFESDLPTVWQVEPRSILQRADPVVSIFRIERFRIQTEKTEHDCFRRRVPYPRQREGALQFDINAFRPAEYTGKFQIPQKTCCNPDRADRVRTRRAYADTKEIENGKRVPGILVRLPGEIVS
jgi:hypothetical protein